MTESHQASNNVTAAAPRPISEAVGTKLLFENDRVRVWDLQLAAGDSTGLHRHRHDFLYVVIGEGEFQTAFEDGSRDPARRMVDGDVRFREVGQGIVHEGLNVGSRPWRNVVVEFLK